MEIKKGSVVLSKAGRDRGTFLAVYGEENGRVLVADGGERPLRRPKKKNPRHIRLTGMVLPQTAFRSDRALRKALQDCADHKSEV